MSVDFNPLQNHWERQNSVSLALIASGIEDRMTKRHVFLKALIASLPIAAQIYRRMPEDPAAGTMTARIAACAAELAKEAVTEWES